MAFEYFLYDTNFNNTLIDRGVNSFAPLPPNTGEIFIDFDIPEIQPLYLYKESTGSIIVNDDQTINNYLNSTEPLIGEDDVNQNQFTGYTATTRTELDRLNSESALYAFSKTLGNGTQTEGFGLTVTRTSVGRYDYTFNQPTSSINYGVFAQPFGSTTDTNTQISIVSTTGFRVEIGQGDNGTLPDVLVDLDHSVGVFGVPISVDNKINIVTGVTGNLGTFNVSGNLVDGGATLQSFIDYTVANDTKVNTISATTDQKIDKVTGAIGNLGTFNSSGNLDNTNISLSAITGNSGSVNLQSNNINVPNTPHDTINFDSGFTVTDNTGGKATVSLAPVSINPLDGLCELIDGVGGQEITNVIPIPMKWDTHEFIDNTTYSHIISGSTITILKSGYYEVSFNVNSNNQTNGRSTTGVQIRKNGTVIDKTLTANYTRNSSNDDNHNSLPTTTIQFNINDTLDVILFRLGDNNSTLTKPNASFVRIKYLG